MVFAVNVIGSEVGANYTFDRECKVLATANVDYTILKFSAARKMAEAKFPYRIVRGSLPLPTEEYLLSSDDLMRVIFNLLISTLSLLLLLLYLLICFLLIFLCLIILSCEFILFLGHFRDR